MTGSIHVVNIFCSFQIKNKKLPRNKWYPGDSNDSKILRKTLIQKKFRHLLLLSGTGKVQTDKTGNKSKQLQLKSQILTEMYENIGTFPKISIIYDIHDPWDP